MNLSVLYWVLCGVTLVLPLASFTSVPVQIWGLFQVAVVILLGTFYWIAQRKQIQSTTASDALNREETQKEIAEYKDKLDLVLSSVHSAISASERSSADVDALDNVVQTTTENAKQAALLSHQSRTTVESSVKAISELYQSMNEVSHSSKKIEEILRMIEDIAFQTNLLALNAAVEAARAGEQGKGFAVVAEAVRTLAQKSSGAAKDITVLIHETTNNINKGCSQAQSSRELLNSILTGILKVSDINNEISLSSQDQAASTRSLKNLLSELAGTQNEIIQKIQSNSAPPSMPKKLVVEAKPAPAPVAVTKQAPVAVSKTPLSVVAKPGPVVVETRKKVVEAITKKSILKAETKKPVVAKTESGKPVAVATPIVKEAKVTPISAATKPLTSKTPQDLIPFDEDEDRIRLTKASDF